MSAQQQQPFSIHDSVITFDGIPFSLNRDGYSFKAIDGDEKHRLFIPKYRVIAIEGTAEGVTLFLTKGQIIRLVGYNRETLYDECKRFF